MVLFFPHLASRRVLGSVFASRRNDVAKRVGSRFISITIPTRDTQSTTLALTLGRTLQPNAGTWKGGKIALIAKGITIVSGVGLGLFNIRRTPVLCDAPPTEASDPIESANRPPPPTSSVSIYELGFGTVAGICAGVFVKKGAKAVAWFLGGVFFLLQYLRSASLLQVNWSRMSSKFEDLFYVKDASGVPRPPNVISLWHWLIDFLTADFQPRASFIAGFALGLRIG